MDGLRLRKKLNLVQLFPQTQVDHRVLLFYFKHVRLLQFKPVYAKKKVAVKIHPYICPTLFYAREAIKIDFRCRA